MIEQAESILERSSSPVVRYRILRDVLCKSPDDSRLLNARQDLDSSSAVQVLATEQWEDGSWGAFRSMDTNQKQKIRTTEMGVERALALGLDGTHPVLEKAASYILKLIQNKIAFPDRPEKNDRWQTGVKLFLSSTLSQIYPKHPILKAERQLWSDITQRTFASGKYSAKDEIQAHDELTGATVLDSYLVLGNKYQLNLLGSIPGMLSPDLEMALLGWIWERSTGIGYITVQLGGSPPGRSGGFDRWLASLELLARLFPSWTNFAGRSIEWIKMHASSDGYWDFGPMPSRLVELPLSDSWRNRQDRVFDWTTRILALLKKYSSDVSLHHPAD